MNNLDILYARPAMYLIPYEKKVDAASFFVNFLIAVFDSQELGSPNSVNITTSGQYFSIQANACSFPSSMVPLSSLFDMANFRQPFLDEFYSLGFMRPLVWFSDYCLVELTSKGKLSQQAFLRGTPYGQNFELPLDGKAGRIGFRFTLPPQAFPEVTLDIARLRRVIMAWEQGDLAPPLLTEPMRPTLHKQWREQSKYHHSLKMSTNKSTNLVMVSTDRVKQDSPYLPRALAAASIA